MAFDAWNDAGDKPARLTHLDDRNDRTVLSTLYSVGPSGPDHDAVMRIGGEAPGRRAHSRNRCQHHGLLRVTATSDRDRIPTISGSPAPSLSCPISSLTLPAIRRRPEPRQWSPGAIRQLVTCVP